MKIWHIKSHNILLSGDGENTNSLQFNGIWIKFVEQGKTLNVEIHQCAFIDTVTARGEPGRIRLGEATRTDRTISRVLDKLEIQNSPSKRDTLTTLASVRHLFPQGVQNFNNLIYNIKSYNKAHFSEEKDFYNQRKGYGSKYLDSSFALGSTGPLLSAVLTSAVAATGAAKFFSYLGLGKNILDLFADTTFSSRYEYMLSLSTKKRVIILDFDKENDSLRDSAGHIIRAFSRNIINKHNEVVKEESVLQAMYHSVSDYLENYMKRAKSQM